MYRMQYASTYYELSKTKEDYHRSEVLHSYVDTYYILSDMKKKQSI